MSEFLGADLGFDGGDLAVGADGDLTIASGGRCLTVDLVNRLKTLRGSDWTDANLGFPWSAWLQTEWAEHMVSALRAAVARELEKDPRVQSVVVQAARSGPATLQLECRVQPIGGGNAFNLVVGFDMEAATVEVLYGA
jgi:hypothetical protein